MRLLQALIATALLILIFGCSTESAEDRFRREVYQACLDRIESDYGGLISPAEAKNLCDDALLD